VTTSWDLRERKELDCFDTKIEESKMEVNHEYREGVRESFSFMKQLTKNASESRNWG
jgi:hypothetical protein